VKEFAGAKSAPVIVTNQKLSLRGSTDDRSARLTTTVASANEREFMVQLGDVPAWLAAGLTVSGEVRSDKGVSYFTTNVGWILPESDNTWVMLAQPQTAMQGEQRRSVRVAVEFGATWSELDSDMHPGPEHHARVHDLSANGMRVDAGTDISPGDNIVASLTLSSGLVNIIGTVLAVGPPDVNTPAGQMRIAFHRMNDQTWSALIDEVASTAGLNRVEVVAPSVTHEALPREAILAYAGSDRRG